MEPPAPDELEITLFGPGRGECVVVHLGRNEWIVVDSCRDKSTKKPAALAYFDKLELDPSQCVQAIVATHWDSDHIVGISSLVAACPEAAFWCSGAISSDEFEALLDLAADRPRAFGIRLRELAAVVAARRGRSSTESPRFATEGTLILERQADETLPRRVIHALSPSMRSCVLTRERARAALDNARDVGARVEALSRNDASVALAVCCGKDAALLGSDLERSRDELRGWTAAVHRAQELEITCDMIKIPHHGSNDAHDPAMWDSIMASPDPAAAVTPFFGQHSLPRHDDRRRIRGLTGRAYLTTERSRTPEEVKLAEVALTVGAQVHATYGELGHVMWRRKMDLSSDWRVTLDTKAVLV